MPLSVLAVTGKQIIGAVAAFVIYLPFARAYDKKLVDDEVASTEETAGDSVSV